MNEGGRRVRVGLLFRLWQPLISGILDNDRQSSHSNFEKGLEIIEGKGQLRWTLAPEWKIVTRGPSHGRPQKMSSSPPPHTEQPNPISSSTTPSYDTVGVFWDYGKLVLTLTHTTELNFRQRTARPPRMPPDTTPSIISVPWQASSGRSTSSRHISNSQTNHLQDNPPSDPNFKLAGCL